MKKSFLILFIFVLAVGMLLFGCEESGNKKVNEATSGDETLSSPETDAVTEQETTAVETPAVTEPLPEENIGQIFSSVLANSINSILTISGTIVFCSVISRSILELLPAKGIVYSLILGGMEFVSGISVLSNLPIPLILKLMFSSWIVGFAGLSVHLQVMAIVSKYHLSLLPYIFGKIMQGIISIIYTFIIYKLTNPSLTAFSNASYSYSAFTSSLFVIMTVLFIVILSITPPLLGFIGKFFKKGTKKPSWS